MAASVVYSAIFGAVLASIRAVSTRLIVFDTAVADLTDEVSDPVELLFGTQLGGGRTAGAMLKRAASLVGSGVTTICLLALRNTGAPGFHPQHASAFAAMGIPTFACTPDVFPELIATAIERRDVSAWAAAHDIAVARAEA